MSPRILIVEDEEDNLTLLMHILTMVLNLDDVAVARDGHEAIRVAYENIPDIILMDLTLPKLSGWEATRSLRSDSAFEHTVILALTAHAMVGDREKALAAGCNDYYSKPINVDSFIDFVMPYLNNTSESVSRK